MSDWRNNISLGAVNIDVSGADHTLALPCRRIYVGGTGNIDAVMANGTTCLIQSIPVGTVIDNISIRTFKMTTTTATKIVAFI